MTQKLLTGGMVSVVAAAALLLLACNDPAAADWRRCQELEKKGDFGEAIKACLEAHGKGPLTKSGRRAKARVPVLQKMAEQKAGEDARLRLDQARRKSDAKIDELMKQLEGADSDPVNDELRKEREKVKKGGE